MKTKKTTTHSPAPSGSFSRCWSRERSKKGERRTKKRSRVEGSLVALTPTPTSPTHPLTHPLTRKGSPVNVLPTRAGTLRIWPFNIKCTVLSHKVHALSVPNVYRCSKQHIIKMIDRRTRQVPECGGQWTIEGNLERYWGFYLPSIIDSMTIQLLLWVSRFVLRVKPFQDWWRSQRPCPLNLR